MRVAGTVSIHISLYHYIMSSASSSRATTRFARFPVTRGRTCHIKYIVYHTVSYYYFFYSHNTAAVSMPKLHEPFGLSDGACQYSWRRDETRKGNKITTALTRTALHNSAARGAAHTSCIYWPHVVRALRQISCRQYEWTVVCDETEQTSPVRGGYTQIHVVFAYTLTYGTCGALYRDARRLLYSATVREKK